MMSQIFYQSHSKFAGGSLNTGSQITHPPIYITLKSTGLICYA